MLDKLKIIDIPLKKISFKNQLFLYLIFITGVVSFSIIYSYIFTNKFPNTIDKDFNLIVKSIEFGNGPLIHNLLLFKEYKSNFYGIDFYLQKLPLLPILYFFILKISSNFILFIIIKNLVSFSTLYFFSFFSLRSLNKNLSFFLILMIVPFLIPYNLFVSLNYQYSDCILVVLIPSLYLVLISKLKNKFILASIILFFLYLTKTSMFFLTIIIPITTIIIERKLSCFFILLGPIIAIIIWGSFGYKKIDKFVFGADNLSVNSMGMHLVLHDKFFDYFPRKSIDILQNNIKIPKNIKNETEFYKYFEKKNSDFFSSNENKLNYFLDSFKKIKFILLDFRRDASNMENGKFNNSVRISMIPNKIILNLSILLSFIYLIKKLKKNINIKLEIYFIIILSLNMMPHVVAWATSKHLVPAFIVSFYYFYFLLNDQIKKNEQ
tara:strand:+ start:2680 stop:3987 length:1308 start_codon:yes stop_codon:yes gene_type:complete